MTTELKPCPFCGGKVDPEGWISSERKGPECEECGATANGVMQWNTRVTPDVPELVRYKPDSYDAPSISRMLKDEEGGYVRYDQASAMLAAKDAKINELRNMLSSIDAGYNVYDVLLNRAEAAEAKLAERERHIDQLEQMRPFWAQGFSSDSMAAQGATMAIAALHAILGAANQTEAVSKLKLLKDRLAAKDKVIAQWKERCRTYANKLASRKIELNAAETKLAEYEKQEPVYKITVTLLGTYYEVIRPFPIGCHKLYASPAPMSNHGQ